MPEDRNQSAHRRFDLQSREDLVAAMQAFDVRLPVGEDLGVLARPYRIGEKEAFNRLAVHPMEGCDGEEDGSPSSLTFRRYRRFAAGGAGLIWVEATAVVPMGRASPRQLWLHEGNVKSFAKLVADLDQFSPRKPYKVLQLTHSGRYSRPEGQPQPQVAAVNPCLDRPPRAPEVLSDEDLEALIPAYVQSARLAKRAGFDAVDVKACHGYLLGELLGAYTREGPYGGSFAGRTRLLLNITAAIRQEVGMDVATRINAFDEVPQPHGWGSQPDDARIPDFSQITRLATALQAKGLKLINLTAGNPYHNPHVNRPFDAGPYRPPTHPLQQVEKLLLAAKAVKESSPDLTVIGTGLSWIRHLAKDLACGLVASGWCDVVGFGRQAFAYPDFAKDLLAGGLKPERCCITCGKCSEIMRDGGKAGCVIFDRDVYLPIHQEGRRGKAPIVSTAIREHV